MKTRREQLAKLLVFDLFFSSEVYDHKQETKWEYMMHMDLLQDKDITT